MRVQLPHETAADSRQSSFQTVRTVGAGLTKVYAPRTEPFLLSPRGVSPRRRRHWPAAGGVLVALVAAIVSIAPADALASWSIVPSPNNGTGINVLDGVSCPRTRSCTAVGYSHDASRGADQTLIESGTGSSWSIVPSPNNGTNDNDLLGVSCASARSCKAVGFSTNAVGVNQTLIESWNGISWSIDTSPDNGTAYNVLDGVSCRRDQVVHGGGLLLRHKPRRHPDPGRVLERHDLVDRAEPEQRDDRKHPLRRVVLPGQGRARRWVTTTRASAGSRLWSSHGTARPGRSFPAPTWGRAPTCSACRVVRPRSCEAVGAYNSAGLGVSQTLVESWNGTSWSIVPSPNNGTSNNDLLGVSCGSTGSCQAVGLYFNTSLGDYQTLIETRSGGHWSVVPSANNGTAYNVLAAVSCPASARACKAVGNYYDTSLSTYQSLIESND